MNKLEIRNKDKVVAEIKDKMAELNSLCDLIKENDLNIRIEVERITLQGGDRKITEYIDITPSASVKLLTVTYYGEIYSYIN